MSETRTREQRGKTTIHNLKIRTFSVTKRIPDEDFFLAKKVFFSFSQQRIMWAPRFMHAHAMIFKHVFTCTRRRSLMDVDCHCCEWADLMPCHYIVSHPSVFLSSFRPYHRFVINHRNMHAPIRCQLSPSTLHHAPPFRLRNKTNEATLPIRSTSSNAIPFQAHPPVSRWNSSSFSVSFCSLLLMERKM